jgi:hypothetical protein
LYDEEGNQRAGRSAEFAVCRAAHCLRFAAQVVSRGAAVFEHGATGRSILAYDTAGNFVESVDGLSFNGESNVFPVHIAINPSRRSGFVDGPATDDSEIQSFTY